MDDTTLIFVFLAGVKSYFCSSDNNCPLLFVFAGEQLGYFLEMASVARSNSLLRTTPHAIGTLLFC